MPSRLPLSDEDLARLREILQVEEIPHEFDSEEFTAACRKVMDVDPELAQRYVLAVPDGSEAPRSTPPLETEQQARRALNRQRLLELQRRLFFREVDGEWVPNQGKILGVALAVLLVGVVIASYAVYADSQARTAQRLVVSDPVEEEVVVEPLVLPEPEPAPSPSLSIAELPALPPAPSPAPEMTPAPVVSVPVPAPAPSPAPAPVVVPSPPAPQMMGELDYNPLDPNETVLPLTVAALPAGRYDPLAQAPLGVYAQTIAPPAATPGAALTRSLTPFRDEPGAAAAPATLYADPPAQPGGISLFAAAVSNDSPLVASSSTTPSVPATLFNSREGQAGGGSLTVASASGGVGAAGGMTTLYARPARAGADAVTTEAAALVGGELGSGTQSVPQSVAAGLVEGARIVAELATSATVLDGQPAPVLAETVCAVRDLECEPWLFAGTAMLLAGDRLVINFDRVMVGGEALPVTAMALAPDMSTSIPAQVVDHAPTLAQDMFRSALSGVSEYVQALANRTRTTIVGDQVVTEALPPGLNEFVMGSVASSFGFDGTRMSFVRVAELPAGTPVVVLVGSHH